MHCIFYCHLPTSTSKPAESATVHSRNVLVSSFGYRKKQNCEKSNEMQKVIIATTKPSWHIHGMALVLPLLLVTAVPNINALRGDIGFGTIAFVFTNLTATLVLGMMATVPNSPFGLGFAERV